MTPYEMLLSESQERMLLVATRGREHEVIEVFAKWGLDAVEVGHVTDDDMMRVVWKKNTAANIPAKALADEAPVYKRPIAAPTIPRGSGHLIEFSPAGTDFTKNFLKLLAWPAIPPKRRVFQEYHS